MTNLFVMRLHRHEARMIADEIATMAIKEQITNQELILGAEEMLEKVVAHTGHADHRITPEEVRAIFKQAMHYLTTRRAELISWVEYSRHWHETYEETGIRLYDRTHRENLQKYRGEDHHLDAVSWEEESGKVFWNGLLSPAINYFKFLLKTFLLFGSWGLVLLFSLEFLPFGLGITVFGCATVGLLYLGNKLD